MKTIEQVLEMGDRETVDAVAGIIVSIDTPREPSAAQATKGIHTQNFVIQSSQGATLNCQFLNASMHFDQEARGDLIILKAADTEKGPYGLQTNLYQGKLSLVVSKQASFALKPQKGAPTQPSRELPPTPKANRTPVKVGIKNAARAYANIYKALIAALGEVIPLKDCSGSVSTLFIEGARGGWLYQDEEPEVEVRPEAIPLPKAPVAADPNQVIKHLITDSINGTLSQRINQADRAVRTVEGVSWEMVYDGLVAAIGAEQRMTASEILPHADRVYDNTRRNLGPANAETNIAREIALDFRSFKEQVFESFASFAINSSAADEAVAEKTPTPDPYEDIPA